MTTEVATSTLHRAELDEALFDILSGRPAAPLQFLHHVTFDFPDSLVDAHVLAEPRLVLDEVKVCFIGTNDIFEEQFNLRVDLSGALHHLTEELVQCIQINGVLAALTHFLEEISWLEPPRPSVHPQGLNATLEVPSVDRVVVVEHHALVASLIGSVLTEELLHTHVSLFDGLCDLSQLGLE